MLHTKNLLRLAEQVHLGLIRKIFEGAERLDDGVRELLCRSAFHANTLVSLFIGVGVAVTATTSKSPWMWTPPPLRFTTLSAESGHRS